ncbi:MAG: site-2 protease family protein [Clostridia bacterium]|nr:site-2 protease family protein [Clostridia bacterium]
MLRDLIEAVQNGDVYTLIAILITSAILIFLCLPSHEFAHSWAAHKLGDNTAKCQGRLTLNPFKHLDLLGTAMMLLIGVGYAKPVPVNMFNFKERKKDMALVALAGPMMNLFCGIIFVFLDVLFSKYVLLQTSALDYYNSSALFYFHSIIKFVLSTTAQISVSLAIFNLIPIPPFDGSRILGFFLPDKIYYKIMQYEQIIFIVVLVMLWGGFLSGPLSTMMENVLTGIYRLLSLPFGGISSFGGII